MLQRAEAEAAVTLNQSRSTTMPFVTALHQSCYSTGPNPIQHWIKVVTATMDQNRHNAGPKRLQNWTENVTPLDQNRYNCVPKPVQAMDERVYSTGPQPPAQRWTKVMTALDQSWHNSRPNPLQHWTETIPTTRGFAGPTTATLLLCTAENIKRYRLTPP